MHIWMFPQDAAEVSRRRRRGGKQGALCTKTMSQVKKVMNIPNHTRTPTRSNPTSSSSSQASPAYSATQNPKRLPRSSATLQPSPVRFEDHASPCRRRSSDQDADWVLPYDGRDVGWTRAFLRTLVYMKDRELAGGRGGVWPPAPPRPKGRLGCDLDRFGMERVRIGGGGWVGLLVWGWSVLQVLQLTS